MMPKFMSTNLTHGKVYLIQHYVIKMFDSDLQQVGGFLWVLQSPPPIKLTTNDLIEILLKVALNNITLTLMMPQKNILSVKFCVFFNSKFRNI